MSGRTAPTEAGGSCKTQPRWQRPDLVSNLSLAAKVSILLVVWERSRNVKGHLLVPALERSVGQCRLSNCDTLAFASGNSAYELVSDFGMNGVADAVHGHDDVAQMLAVPAKAG